MKLERNAPCPCGSGKKYKKCCYTDAKKNAALLRAVSLAETEEEVREILNRPVQVYRLKVTLKSMGGTEMEEEVSRTVELVEEADLYDLHLSIQRAFDWDNDHMFSFYLSDNWRDPKHEYSGNPLGGHHAGFGRPPMQSAAGAELKDLGLKPDRRFWYLFDYGDELLHQVDVEALRDQKADEDLPRVVAEVGTPPSQYGDSDWDEDEDEDEDEGK